MIKLPHSKYEVVSPLLDELIRETETGDVTQTSYVMGVGSLRNMSGQGDIFVDDESNPSMMLILTVGMTQFIEKKCCMVNAVYCKPDKRGSTACKQLTQTIESYAKQNHCALITGGSNVRNGKNGIGNFWEKLGAQPWETVYVKTLWD